MIVRKYEVKQGGRWCWASGPSFREDVGNNYIRILESGFSEAEDAVDASVEGDYF